MLKETTGGTHLSPVRQAETRELEPPEKRALERGAQRLEPQERHDREPQEEMRARGLDPQAEMSAPGLDPKEEMSACGLEPQEETSAREPWEEVHSQKPRMKRTQDPLEVHAQEPLEVSTRGQEPLEVSVCGQEPLEVSGHGQELLETSTRGRKRRRRALRD